MNITQTSQRLFSLFLLFAVTTYMVACGPGGSTELPGERPYGSIAGHAVDATLVGSTVTVYGFANGARGVTLGSAITDENGRYTLDIQAPSQPILIEIRGGSYVEDATATPVSLADGLVLRAIARYVSGEAIDDLMVTPLTHLAAGLAEYKIVHGVSPDQALTDATSAINGFFAIDTGTTLPLDITDASNAIAALDDQALYGFYLAGLSSWTAWASHENGAPHSIYSSIALAQILYNDIRSDGMFDGMGYNVYGTALMQLAFGRVAINANTYRSAFSLHMLAIANSEKNKIGLGLDTLLTPAQDIASQTGSLLGTSTPFDINSQAPDLTITPPTGEYHSGDFSLEVGIGGLLGAEQLSVFIDGDLNTEQLNPVTSSTIIIDSTGYADGEHTILVTATDTLGNEASSSFTVQFDNTAPVVNVSSPTLTNQATTLVSGTYSDNISGVQSITVQGHPASLFTDGTWSRAVTLSAGENTIPITVIDQAGKRLDTQTLLYLDTIVPVIDTTDRHSLARFSNGDGSYIEAAMHDVNDAASPLYFETDKVDLNGVLIDRTELDSNTIPYFGFTVSDQMGPSATTAPDDIQVRIQYEREGVVLSPWRDLDPISGEYLVPLVSEMLAPNWHQATPAEQHVIRIEASDVAGNVTKLSFSFYADFYVPAFNIDTVSDLGADLFTGTAFADRATLNDTEFASTAYTFTNTVGKSFYLSPDDASTHTTTQTVDQLVREHLIHLKTTPEWRIGEMTATDQCPTMTSWKSTSSVYNWTGTDWVKEQVPAASYGEPSSIFSDALPVSPLPSDWSDVPDFDDQFKIITIDNSPLYILTYRYDYILKRTFFPKVGYVSTWVLQDLVTGTPTTCDPVRNFQQHDVYAYESVSGYPKPVLSSVSVAGTPDFATTHFTVTDNDTDLAITPVGGWYRIPAGHSVTITKFVTTPVLTFYNEDVSDLKGFSSYTPNWHDSSITWGVNRNLMISVSHDVGEANISAMPVRNLNSGVGIMSYQITH
jgi:hypothetical protein